MAGKLLYNQHCYFASGNLWLSFQAKQGIQVTRGRDEVCFISQLQHENHLFASGFPLNLECLDAWEGFVRMPEHAQTHSAIVFMMAHGIGCSRSWCVSPRHWQSDCNWVNRQHCDLKRKKNIERVPYDMFKTACAFTANKTRSGS